MIDLIKTVNAAFLALVVVGAAIAGENAEIRQIFDVRSTMRDGVTLSSDVWLPEKPGKYPTILMRTPYMKTNHSELAAYFAKEGYAFVVQDVRGRGDSEGEFNFFFQESPDGYDSIEALAAEPWSNGKVCTMGVSYLGSVQWLAARTAPPHLVCIAPTAPAGNYENELPYVGGAFTLRFALTWLNGTSGNISQGDSASTLDLEKIYKHRPLLTMDEKMGRKMRLYREFLQHPTMDDYWKRIQFNEKDFANIDVPFMTIAGHLLDGDLPGTLYYWRGMSKYSKSTKDRYLIIGPWSHVQAFAGGATDMGGWQLSEDSIIDNKKLHLEFFDYYLKETASSFNHPQANIYITGRNEWRSFKEYPVKNLQEKRLYLSSRGNANSVAGDGKLLEKTSNDQGVDEYLYDPQKPVPSPGFDNENYMKDFFGDRRIIENRADVLNYTSDALTEAIEVTGDVFVELYAATDARDTDFTAKVIDVFPDGRAIRVGQRHGGGIIRARYRNRNGKEELLTPGKVEKYSIDLGFVAHSFLPGHKIRVEISSSDVPIYNPNQNTGNPIATDTEWRLANQKIYHDKKRPSALVLPIIPR